ASGAASGAACGGPPVAPYARADACGMMGRMRRISAVLAGVLMALAIALVPSAASAFADDDQLPDAWGREITRWDQTFALNADGSVDVVLEIDFDFGNDPGHGPYMVLPLRQTYDETFDRVYRVSNLRA